MLITYKNIHKIRLPAYILPSSNWHTQDGLVYVDNGLVDDRNMPGATLGIRRMQTPQKGLLPLKKSVTNLLGLIQSKSHAFIDSKGMLFIYEKTKFCKLRYSRIRRVDRKGTASLVWVRGIKSPFTVPRPPESGRTWVGIIYLHEVPWILYEYSTEYKSDTRRKV